MRENIKYKEDIILKKLTIFLGTIFLLVSILGIYLSLKLPNFNNAVMFSMKPSFYPMIIFSLLFLSCIALIIKNLFANISEESKLHLINKDMRIMFGLYFLYILMLPFLQFIISTIIFFMLSTFYLMKDRTKYNSIILSIVNIICTAALYFLFVKLFNVPL